MKAVADNTPSSTTVDDADADHHEVVQLDYSSDNDIIEENILIASNSIMAAAESSFSRIMNELTPSLTTTTTSLSSQQAVLAPATSSTSRQLSGSGVNNNNNNNNNNINNDNNNDRDNDCDFVISRDVE